MMGIFTGLKLGELPITHVKVDGERIDINDIVSFSFHAEPVQVPTCSWAMQKEYSPGLRWTELVLCNGRIVRLFQNEKMAT